MPIESFENRLLSTVVNPALKAIISKFDIECEVDGSLMLNSLRQFLGENLELCARARGPDIGCIHNIQLWEKMVPPLVARLEKV